MMLPESLTIELVTPDRQLVSETVSVVQLPGKNGYLGILPGHAPLLTELGVGELSYRRGAETYYATVIGGFAEVLPDRVIALADIAERAEEIDLERARRARDRAAQRLAKADPNTDWARAVFAIQRAQLRLQVAAKSGAVTPLDEEHHPAP